MILPCCNSFADTDVLKGTCGIGHTRWATQEKLYTKMVSNVREVKARKAIVILITKEGMEIEENLFDYHLTIPDSLDEFTAIPTAVLLQLIAYYTAVDKKLNVDQPRNLAKSVTVE